MIKVFLGGEGSNELGTRWHRPMGDQPGVVEALLRRVRADGWCVGGARLWKTIRKYQAGVARGAPNHGDARNVLGLVLHAYEAACELLVFVRDDDGDPDRDPAIAATLDAVATYGFADAYCYELAVVGGLAKPKLEGWVLCLRGVPRTDEMTREAVDRALAETDVRAKSTEDFVAVVEAATLPRDGGSLADWLRRAEVTLGALIDGASR